MSTFITGPAGCGKTTELLRRAREAANAGPVFVTSPAPSSLESLRLKLGEEKNARVCDMHELAAALVEKSDLIDDVRAAELFVDAAEPLFNLSWLDFLETDLDFEVPGLRAPQRFAEAAFRLFCKLRDALITPEAFLESALRGATQFYAKPPNLSGADLLHYTKETYRDSLAVESAELARQYKHEVDLAKILTKLYRAYLDHPVRAGALTPRDAVAQAVAQMRTDGRPARLLRERLPAAFVDDAQELTIGDLAFLQTVYGETLESVTFAFDKDSATSVFSGARPDRIAALPGERIVLETQYRPGQAIEAAASHMAGARRSVPGASPVDGAQERPLQLFRATTQQAEAHFIADYVVELLAAGSKADDIALLFRSVDSVQIYRDALLQKGVPAQVCGDLNIFCEPAALDALAVLWSVYDPFRHDYLLRVLQGRFLNLSDAAVQTLCSDPPDAQTSLFNEPQTPQPERRSGRWDSRRDVRLGMNVLRAERDAELSNQARERLARFRSLRDGWIEALRTFPLQKLVRKVWAEGLALDGPAGSARAEFQQRTLERIARRIDMFERRNRNVSLGEFLEDAERRMHSTFEALELHEHSGAVRLLNIDASRGREFDHVILPNARAGSFPRWYVPDAFMYSPSLGMIAKENAGDALASRTAKFTYYMWHMKIRERFNAQERNAFVFGLRRAKKSALVTASGRTTKGITAPEFLHELQAARLPGAYDHTDRWRPAREALQL